MASFIFVKNLPNDKGALVAVAADNTAKNSLNLDLSNYKVIDDIADADFNNVRLYKKRVEYNESDVLTYSNNEIGCLNLTVLESNRQSIIDQINAFLDNNSGHPLYSLINTYKSLLSGYDFSGVIFPQEKALEEILDDAGETVVSRLQIP